MSVGERPLHQPRLAEMVAAILRDRILAGQLGDGVGLPRQEDLLAEFGVSQPSLREALRILESEGLISVRRGSRGGAVVHVPDAGHVARTAALVLGVRGVPPVDVAQALSLIEPVCAALCAGRDDRDAAVVPALQAAHAACVRAVDDDEDYPRAALAFRRALVELCGNATLALVAGSLGELWSIDAAAGPATGPAGVRADRGADLAAQAALVQRITDGDADGAAARASQLLGPAHRSGSATVPAR